MEDIVTTILASSTSGAVGGAAVYWFANNVIAKRIELSYQKKLETHKSDQSREIEKLRSEIRTSELTEQRRGELKREACLEALDIVDYFFSIYDWPSGIEPDPQDKIAIGRVRSCCNRLALTCENGEVLELFKDSLRAGNDANPPKPLSADLIVDLRNAIRRELGFGSEIDKDRERAWISQIP